MAATLLTVAACSGDEAGPVTAPAPPTPAPPLATLPPVTEPPATQPPATAPPATVPAATTPPSTAVPTTPAPTTTTTTTTLPPSPLNGLGVADGEALARRVIAVKIDNHERARPQSGLQEAEAVFELLVEGGLSRFIALFHTVDSDYIGPIRSIRPTDATLVKPLGAPLQISGGQAWVLSLVRRLDADYMVEVAGGGTFRIDSRPGPHNLYGETDGMRERADRLGFPDDPPPPMFTFGDPTPSTTEATTITVSWSGGNDVTWEFDGERYLRFQQGDAHTWVDEDGAGSQVAFDTLVVLFANRYTARPRASESGSSVPALDTVGSGTALLFYDGLVVTGSWDRDSNGDPFSLSTDNGETMVVPPGRLWVSVFPSDRDVTWEP